MIPEKLRLLPCWQGDIAFAEPLTGGLSNEAWKVTDATGSYVVRFGKDFSFHHVDRNREVMAARAAHTAGFGPAVVYSAPGVCVGDFVPSVTWTASDVRAAPEKLGRLLRRFHETMPDFVSGPAFLFWPFHVIRDYGRTISAGNSPFAAKVPDYLDLSRKLETAQTPMPIVFGHHDLLPANILDDGERLWLIDYEYAGFGTAMFDLAGAASNAGMEGDEVDAFLSAYFGQNPSQSVIRAFDAMQSISLLREAMWAMVSDIHMAETGVDYRLYAGENLEKLTASLSQFQAKHGTL